MNRINYIRILLLIASCITCRESSAQLNPMGAMYYQNQYLGNAAFAGKDEGMSVNAGYRTLWSLIPGAPADQSVTGEYRFGKAGVGINLYNDKAGLITRTRTVASYAYHMPVGDNNQELHFGLSLGFLKEKIYEQDMIGNSGDIAVGAFNQRETYIDGDFGLAYTANKITIQAALPNMKDFLQKDNRSMVNYSVFFTAISYRISLGEGLDAVGIEPKLSYRGVKGFDNMWDLGSNISIADKKINVFGMYHNTGSTTFGMGVSYKERLVFQGIYTTETTTLRGNSNGNFEVNVKARIF